MNDLQDTFIRDNGITADDLNPALAAAIGTGATADDRGHCWVDTAESRTNTSFGTLTTPDKVTVALPTAGLLYIAYQAQWKVSAGGDGRAGVFLGSNQVPIATGTTIAAQGAATGHSNYLPLFSTNYGIATTDTSGSDFVGYANTGQVLGGVTTGTTFPSPILVVFADAGTYDVTVQFRTATGSVTVKNRKLWVETRAF